MLYVSLTECKTKWQLVNRSRIGCDRNRFLSQFSVSFYMAHSVFILCFYYCNIVVHQSYEVGRLKETGFYSIHTFSNKCTYIFLKPELKNTISSTFIHVHTYTHTDVRVTFIVGKHASHLNKNSVRGNILYFGKTRYFTSSLKRWSSSSR